MSVIGKSVYHVCDVSNLKFGTVIAEKVINKWRWLRVDWKNGIPTNSYNKPSVRGESDWIRIDAVTIFEPKKMMKELKRLRG